jgi:Family of unknown function (DUF5681)
VSLVQSKPRTTRVGGVTGQGFKPGQSGNPGGRPKGLARRVRELVGDDGDAIAQFMYSVMKDVKARTADRLDAGRWLADRGFGRSVQPVDLDVNQYPAIDITMVSTEDLETLLAILDRSGPEVTLLAQQSGEIPMDFSQSRQLPVPARR